MERVNPIERFAEGVVKRATFRAAVRVLWVETLEQRQFLTVLPGTYHLTYDDEFNTLKLSTYNSSGSLLTSGYLTRDTLDNAGYNQPPPGNAEQEYYVNPAQEISPSDNPFSINNSVLSITANPTPANMVGQGTNVGNGLTEEPYTSGMLSTGQGGLQATYPEPDNYSTGFSQTYGYFEMRCEVPNAPGMWPAFWLLPQPFLGSSTPNTEYDIFEIPVNPTGNEPENTRTIYRTSHLNNVGTGFSYTLPSGEDGSTAFHTYGFEWDATGIRWYVDGVLTATTANVCSSPMYMLMNLAVGGTWPGSPTGASEFPQSFKIDYVRVYSDDASVPEISGQSGYGVDSATLEDITVDPEPAMGGAILVGLVYLAGRRPGDQARKNLITAFC